MSNRKSHRRGEAARTESGPRYESKNPGSGSNSTHVARSRKKWKRRGARSERRNGKTSPKVRLGKPRGADRALRVIQRAREERTPLTISTSWGTLQDCAIQEIGAPVRDEAGGVSITLRLKPITVKAAAGTAGQRAGDLSEAELRAFKPNAQAMARDAGLLFGRDIEVDPDAARNHAQPFPPLAPRAADGKFGGGATAAAERPASLSDFTGAMEWLATGERGASSETILSCITGIRFAAAFAPPFDPADLRRCRLLLEAVPSLWPRFPEVSAISKEWAAIVDAWDELCHLMDVEAPHWRTGHGDAPRLYERMHELLRGGKR